MLFIDEDVAAGNELLAFAIMRASGHMVDLTLQARFEEEECIPGGGYVPLESRV